MWWRDKGCELDGQKQEAQAKRWPMMVCRRGKHALPKEPLYVLQLNESGSQDEHSLACRIRITCRRTDRRMELVCEMTGALGMLLHSTCMCAQAFGHVASPGLSQP